MDCFPKTPSLPLIVLGVLMFGTWTAAYIAIIYRAWKDKSYGIPIIDGGLNVSWEAIFTFNLAGALTPALNWGNGFWFGFDALNVLQYYLYGKHVQTNSWLKKHWYVVLTLTIVTAGIGVWMFMIYFNDVYGVASSMIMDILMSTLFIGMLFNRPDLRGLSYAGAWLRMLGNAFGFAFCFFWWPEQFVDGQMCATVMGEQVIIEEPRSFAFLNFLYITIPILDCLYIYLFAKRRKEIRENLPLSFARVQPGEGDQ